MRLNHSLIPAALVISGLLLLGLAARTGAAAASDCPCIRTGAGVCVPDAACEARQRQMRDRLQPGLRERETHTAPRGGAAMDYRLPTVAPAPSAIPPPGEARAPPIVVPSIRPAEAPSRAQNPGTPTAQPGWASNGGRLRILETGYGYLPELGKEDGGYGLYSYAILPSDSKRAAIFLGGLFKEIPSIGQTSAQRSQLNVFYVPIQKDRQGDLAALIQASGANAERMGADFSRSFYDYKMARALLDHVCNPPADSIRQLCNSDLSRGPYIFTYASPASSMNSVPPPFLFVDLSSVHEQAFGELIAAFRAQVKRDDITDQARIRTLRLTILNVALTAADWVSPVEKAIADIVHSPSEDDKKQ